MPSVSIATINFHDGKGATSFDFAGSHGYQLPQGYAAISVDFRIEETDGNFIVLTEVIAPLQGDYNDLVRIAYQQLWNRLERLGKLADELRVAASAGERKE